MRDHTQRKRNAVRPIHIFDLAAVNLAERGRQTDERAHGNDEYRHGRDQRFLCGRVDRSEDSAHKEKENERNKVAGNEHRLAADIHFKLQSNAVYCKGTIRTTPLAESFRHLFAHLPCNTLV